MPLDDLLRQRIRDRGPLTVAAFMDLALYHPEFGFYARGPQVSGRTGDSVTSADLGPLFGELLAVQLAEMASLLGPTGSPFTLVEAGAGDARLSHAILRGLKKVAPHVCSHTHLHLVERSAAALAAQHAVLAAWTGQAIGTDTLPGEFEGVIVANELLDAMPVHQVVMREDGLRELFVDLGPDGRLVTREGAPSTPALARQLSLVAVTLAPGACAEVPLAAMDWVRDAASRLQRGFMILVDYGNEAPVLCAHADGRGTLRTNRRPHQDGSAGAAPAWLDRPGEHDITADVDFSSIRLAAEAQGCTTMGLMDQTYFLMAVAGSRLESFDEAERQAFNALVRPGGIGSTMKVLVVGKGMGAVSVRGCSSTARLT